MSVTAKFHLLIYWYQIICYIGNYNKYVFTTSTQFLLPIHISFVTTARIRLANEILLSLTYRFFSVKVPDIATKRIKLLLNIVGAMSVSVFCFK